MALPNYGFGSISTLHRRGICEEITLILTGAATAWVVKKRPNTSVKPTFDGKDGAGTVRGRSGCPHPDHLIEDALDHWECPGEASDRAHPRLNLFGRINRGYSPGDARKERKISADLSEHRLWK